MFNKCQNNTIKIVTIFSLLMLYCLNSGLAQKAFKVSEHREILLTPPSKKITAVIDTRHKPKISPDKTYFWYDNVDIYETPGGYEGYVLDGKYVESCFPGNNLSVSGNITEGVKDGKWTYWFPNNNLKEISHWENGRLNGVKIMYAPDGKLLMEENYRKGLLNGRKIYYENDSVKKVEFYKNNVIVKGDTVKSKSSQKTASVTKETAKGNVSAPANTNNKKDTANTQKKKGIKSKIKNLFN